MIYLSFLFNAFSTVSFLNPWLLLYDFPMANKNMFFHYVAPQHEHIKQIHVLPLLGLGSDSKNLSEWCLHVGQMTVTATEVFCMLPKPHKCHIMQNRRFVYFMKWIMNPLESQQTALTSRVATRTQSAWPVDNTSPMWKSNPNIQGLAPCS